MENTENYTTVAVAAQHFGVNERTLYKAIHSGEIPAVKLGSTYRLKLSAVEHALTSTTKESK